MTAPFPARAEMAAFAVMALAPLLLTICAALWGGLWVWAAILWMSVLVAALDRVLPIVTTAPADGAEFPGSDALLVTVGVAALLLLPLVVLALVHGAPGWLSGGALMLAAGFWLGQVAHPAAHELIHRSDRRLFRLGQAVYSALLIGHHASSHRLVHHVHVGTEEDPATARAGLGFWRYLPRAEFGGFLKGLRAENALRARGGGRGLHPYVTQLALSALALAVAAWIGGGAGLAVWVALALHAKLQLHLSDYVQHYGLSRARLADGKLEPVGPRHSWNGAEWVSSHMMLNAPRHSDHHAHPARAYPALRLPDADEAPRLPWPLPVACTLALFPSLWRRRMRRHVARWQAETQG